MELNQTLYNNLYNYAKWIIRDEDIAADAVNNVLLNYNAYTGSTTQEFYTWANVIIHRKKIDHWRKKSKETVFVPKDDFPFEQIMSEPPTEETNLYELFAPYLTTDDVDWMVKYWSTSNKSNDDRQKFHYLKEKFLNKKINYNRKKYVLINLKTKKEKEFNTHKQIGDFIKCTSEAVRVAYKNNRKIKDWFIKLNHK